MERHGLYILSKNSESISLKAFVKGFIYIYGNELLSAANYNDLKRFTDIRSAREFPGYRGLSIVSSGILELSFGVSGKFKGK